MVAGQWGLWISSGEMGGSSVRLIGFIVLATIILASGFGAIGAPGLLFGGL